MYKIMIIEDDMTIANIISESLLKWGYVPYVVKDFKNILADFTKQKPHLILLDINLEYYDGFYWCGKIRELSNIPIIFISSRDTDNDKIRAMSQGGDDYLQKPFSLDILIAKVHAMLRRAYSYSDDSLNTLQHREVILNIETNTVYSKDKSAKLTNNECKILALLIRNANKILPRYRLIKALWDDENFVDDNTLTVNINRLRKKLNEIQCHDIIETVKGEGYRIV
ncbi:response regulator transcription factor [Clostridiaceae bacterium M8S5]|nr:response regulator transcription factor [Clostridiaceae bacterium M8S5]